MNRSKFLTSSEAHLAILSRELDVFRKPEKPFSPKEVTQKVRAKNLELRRAMHD